MPFLWNLIGAILILKFAQKHELTVQSCKLLMILCFSGGFWLVLLLVLKCNFTIATDFFWHASRLTFGFGNFPCLTAATNWHIQLIFLSVLRSSLNVFNLTVTVQCPKDDGCKGDVEEPLPAATRIPWGGTCCTGCICKHRSVWRCWWDDVIILEGGSQNFFLLSEAEMQSF